jgi:hypothetical protein
MSKWRCPKCSYLVDDDRSTCAYCNCSKPVVESTTTDVEAVAMDKLTQRLHNIVEGLKPLQKQKLYRYFEDNVL